MRQTRRAEVETRKRKKGQVADNLVDVSRTNSLQSICGVHIWCRYLGYHYLLSAMGSIMMERLISDVTRSCGTLYQCIPTIYGKGESESSPLHARPWYIIYYLVILSLLLYMVRGSTYYLLGYYQGAIETTGFCGVLISWG